MTVSGEKARTRRAALCFFSAAAGVVMQGCASSSVTPVSGDEAKGAPVEYRSGERFFKPGLNNESGSAATDDSRDFFLVSSNVGVQPSERGAAIIVQKGDTMYGIARRFGVSLQALIAANNAAPPYTIEIGQKIWLPPPNIHLVEDGESLRDVAERFSVDYHSLAVMNKLPKPYEVHPGDQIILPTLARDFGEFHIATRDPDAADRGDAGIVSKGFSSGSTTEERVFSDQAVMQPVSSRSSSSASSTGNLDISAKIGPVSAQGFAWPLEGKVIQGFGELPGGVKNEGLNISAREGAPIYAAAAGRVVYAGADLSDFGNLLLIAHEGDTVSAYAHTSRILVDVGDVVTIGQPVAAVGETGAVGDPQLHFQIRRRKTPVDPISLLPKQAAS